MKHVIEMVYKRCLCDQKGHGTNFTNNYSKEH